MFFLISVKYFPFQLGRLYFLKCDSIQYSKVQFEGMRILLSVQYRQVVPIISDFWKYYLRHFSRNDFC